MSQDILLFFFYLISYRPMIYTKSSLFLPKQIHCITSLSKQYIMDNTLISGKRFLFAFGITDGMVYDMTPEQGISLILNINKIKDNMLRGRDNTQDVSK